MATKAMVVKYCARFEARGVLLCSLRRLSKGDSHAQEMLTGRSKTPASARWTKDLRPLMQRISELETGLRSGGGGSNFADVNDRLVLVTARLEVRELLVS